MKVKSESEVAQPCPTLRDPMDCSPPGSSVHGIFQARVLEWGAIAFSRVLVWGAANLRKMAREGITKEVAFKQYLKEERKLFTCISQAKYSRWRA